MNINTDSNKILLGLQESFPQIYDVYNDKSILYTLLYVYANRFANRNSIIARLYGMIGIETTYDEDLERRWGSLLGIKRNNGEPIDEYRSRLMLVYASLAGGTEEAIKYAIASIVNVPDDAIKVYDAWLYDGADNPALNEYLADPNNTIDPENENAYGYGAFVCTVDIGFNEGLLNYHDKIIQAINKTKASGTKPYLIFIYAMCDNILFDTTDTEGKMKIREYIEDINTITSREKIRNILRQDFNEVQTIDNGTLIRYNRGTNSPNIRLNSNFITNNHSDAVDTYVDRISLNTTNDITSYITDDIDNGMAIHSIISDNNIISSYDDDNIDYIGSKNNETKIVNTLLLKYGHTGTNTPMITLNGNFVTNMQANNIDACVDKVFKGGASTPYLIYN